jgi:hypothetical protein
MHTTPALRSIAAALVTGGVLTVAAAGSAAATEPTHSTVAGAGHRAEATVVSLGGYGPCSGWRDGGPWWGPNNCYWNGPGYDYSYWNSSWNSPWSSPGPGFVVVVVPGGWTS